MSAKLTGLVAATHTPFSPDGSLNLAIIEKQAEHLLAEGVAAAFIGGSTGESHSLTLEERLKLATRWFETTKGSSLKVVVHVGANCLEDARTLASQVEKLGAAAISALAPSYFKPANIEALVACCAHIAQAAPQTPFYYYDIPPMTGVSLPMLDFLRAAPDRIPNLAGIKYSNVDLMTCRLCMEADGGRFDILWGVDEMLLAALAFGVQGAVGSTYNFAAPIYLRLMAAFDRGDLQEARRQQLRSIELVRTLAKRGYMASAKALMGFKGIEVGPPRLPHLNLSTQQLHELQAELEAGGFINP